MTFSTGTTGTSPDRHRGSAARRELEGWVRSVADLIGREAGVPVPHGLVDFIVASSDWTLPRETLAARTESVVQHALSNPPEINFHTATREQIRAYFLGPGRFVHMGRYAYGALLGEGGEDRGRSDDRTSSLARSVEMNGGPYDANSLPAGMRRWMMGGRYDAHHVAATGNYLHDLGIDAQQYTGYFVGSSDTVREAIRNHIRRQEAMTDEHVTGAADARAMIGAIRAGKVRLEDAPPSVQKLMEEMRRNGVDPAMAEPEAIQRYLEQNPRALEAARRQAASDEKRILGQSPAAVQEQVERAEVRTINRPTATTVRL